MLAKVSSCAIVGLDGALVDVEVDISNGQPGFTIVGLPDATVHINERAENRILERLIGLVEEAKAKS